MPLCCFSAAPEVPRELCTDGCATPLVTVATTKRPQRRPRPLVRSGSARSRNAALCCVWSQVCKPKQSPREERMSCFRSDPSSSSHFHLTTHVLFTPLVLWKSPPTAATAQALAGTKRIVTGVSTHRAKARARPGPRARPPSCRWSLTQSASSTGERGTRTTFPLPATRCRT